MNKRNIRVGISQGDINGIGYEVIMKTLMDSHITEFCTPILYGSPKVAAYHRKALNINNFSFNTINDASQAHPKKPNLINVLDDEVKVELGKSTPEGGNGSLKSLIKAVADLKDNKIDVLVTAPIDKENIQSENFSFPGHTEFLQQHFGSNEALMLMVDEGLRIGVVTGHIPIQDVSKQITFDAILKKLRVFNTSLIQDFGIRKPRIALLGLNPHAGDNGVLGKEEIDVIIPLINKAKEENILAMGPFPADGFFGSGAYRKFDGILAMYHDQGLIPFKTLAFEKGINFTAGLPIVRTSPGHGTAYELAGQNIASEQSFRWALYLACDIFRNRNLHEELNMNPLPYYDVTRI